MKTKAFHNVTISLTAGWGGCVNTAYSMGLSFPLSTVLKLEGYKTKKKKKKSNKSN